MKHLHDLTPALPSDPLASFFKDGPLAGWLNNYINDRVQFGPQVDYRAMLVEDFERQIQKMRDVTLVNGDTITATYTMKT